MATASFKKVAERFMSCSHRSAKESTNEKPKCIVDLFCPFKEQVHGRRQYEVLFCSGQT
jgi:hypothetical protein